ncbi:MAG: hypothetical protein ACYSWP_00730, partial [Planctomycetota bacterium]
MNVIDADMEQMSKNNNFILIRVLQSGSFMLWIMLIMVPLMVLFIQALTSADDTGSTVGINTSLIHSLALAALISFVAVILGYLPGQLLGTSRHRDILLLLLLMPLLLPRFLLYYAWSLLLSPTTDLGRFFMSHQQLARFVGGFTSALVLILWYWPLAALLIAQAWRNIDRQIWDCAKLEGNRRRVFTKLTIPLLAPTILFTFAVCFVLVLSEFATFHLAGIQTIGARLAILYQQTASVAIVARAAWPVIIIAIIVAFILAKYAHSWQTDSPVLSTEQIKSRTSRWIFLISLLTVSLLVPLLLLIINAPGYKTFTEFLTLHFDELLWSLLVSVLAALFAHLIAYGALSLQGNSNNP